MNKKLALLFIPLFLLGCDPDTSDSPEPQDVFVKLYGSSDFEVAADIIVGDNGGFVIFGTSNSQLLKSSFGGIDRDFYLIFTDSLGNPQPDGQFLYDIDSAGNQLGIDQSAASIIRTSDGGYLMAGNANFLVTTPDGDDRLISSGVLLKVDAAGAVEWGPTRTIETAVNTRVADSLDLTFDPVSQTVESVIETNDGNLLLIGTTNDVNLNKPDFNADADLTDIWVVKFPPTGYDENNLIYDRRIGFPNADEGKAIFEQTDGSLVMIASGPGNDDANGLIDVLYISSDADAFNNNFSEFSSGTGDIVGGATLLSDGGVVVTGASGTTEKTFILRVSSGGAQEAFQVIGATPDPDNPSELLDGSHRGVGVAQMNTGDIAVIGTALSVTGDNNTLKGDEILFFTTDGFGNLLDESDGGILRAFGGNSDDSGSKIMHLPNSRFILLGTIDFESNSTMITLMKASSRGDLIR